MNRSPLALAFFVAAAVSLAAAGERPASERVIGAVQPEIRLSDGTTFRNAKVLDASTEKGTATISDGTRLRTVSLAVLPPRLREQVVAQLARGDVPRYNVYREVRPAPPPDKVIAPPPVVSSPHAPAAPSTIQPLIEQATAAAPDELKLHLIANHERSLASLTCKIRRAEQVPGWQKIRVSGDAAFSTWDNFRRDYVWRTEKFEVDFAIVAGPSLKADRISFGGISRLIESD